MGVFDTLADVIVDVLVDKFNVLFHVLIWPEICENSVADSDGNGFLTAIEGCGETGCSIIAPAVEETVCGFTKEELSGRVEG